MLKISISQIKLFKGCRRAWWFRYHEKLEPVQKAEALETGTNYHAKLEELEKTGNVDTSDFSKESAMAMAFKKYILPFLNVVETEKWVEQYLGGDCYLHGIVDGINKDGGIVEHKSTGAEINEDYEYGLAWDEQILAYMLMTGARKVYYTICRKPTIRQKKNESDEEFFNRMVEWYDDDTEHKIRMLELYRTDEEIEIFKHNVTQMILEIKTACIYYPNEGWCMKWGRRCEYASICLNYDPNQQYVEFTKGS